MLKEKIYNDRYKKIVCIGSGAYSTINLAQDLKPTTNSSRNDSCKDKISQKFKAVKRIPWDQSRCYG